MENFPQAGNARFCVSRFRNFCTLQADRVPPPRLDDLSLIFDIQPARCLRRFLDRLYERLNAKTRPEIEGLRALAGNGVKITRNLYCFQIVEPELMARRNAEPSVGRLVWASLNPAEARSAGSICGRVEM
jgi:hypothetical protein